MCGFVGILKFNTSINTSEERTVQKAIRKISHRGPDSLKTTKVNDRLILAHARLKIIDLEDRANQPFVTQSNDHLVYNGEIYNYEQIKLPNYQYVTSSDTEVLASLLSVTGSSAIKNLNGMYAFGFWDESEQCLFLGRDRVGIKPLYYQITKNEIIFASEIKALAEFDVFNRSLDEESVSEYFQYNFVGGVHSMFKNVKQVAPGSCLKIKDGTLSEIFKLNWDFEQESPYQDDLSEKIHEAVRYRTNADVPITLFLSGGVDSTYLAALLAENKNIEYSTLELEGIGFSEVAKAVRVADKMQQKLHQFKLPFVQEDDFDKIIYYLDDLFFDPACISNFNLYKAFSSKFKVGISGDGADELFLGYHTHKATHYSKFFKSESLSSLLSFLSRGLNNFESTKKYNLFDMLYFYSNSMNKEFPANHLSWRAPGLESVLRVNSSSRLLEQKINELSQLDHLTFKQQLTYLDVTTYLESNILKKVDRMSMANSLEVRVPYLDKSVIERSFWLKDQQKMRGNKQKIFLKEQITNLGFKELVDRRKVGFGADLSRIFSKEKIKEILLSLDNTNFFHYIDRASLEHHFPHLRNYSLFSLLFFKKWLQKYS